MDGHGKLSKGSRIALIGADGMLGSMVMATAPDHVEVLPYVFPEFDIRNMDCVSRALFESSPDFIVNCAALTDVDGCVSRHSEAMAVNSTGPVNLAEVAADIGATLLHVSTDFVFSGSKNTPYMESDPTDPINVYGKSKLYGERGVESSKLNNYFIVRTSWLYGPWGKNFVESIIRLAREREVLNIVSDQIGSPTYSADLAHAIWTLLTTSHYGTYHYSNEGQCSWYEFACEIVRLAGQIEGGGYLSVNAVEPIRSADFPQAAKRPLWSVMSKEKIKQNIGLDVPPWQESLQHYLRKRKIYTDNH